VLARHESECPARRLEQPAPVDCADARRGEGCDAPSIKIHAMDPERRQDVGRGAADQLDPGPRVRTISKGDGPMPTRLQAKLLPQSLSAGRFTDRDRPVRVGPAPPGRRPPRHPADGELGLGDANENRGDPLGRTLEHQGRQLGAVNQPDRPEADRQLAGGRPEVEDGQPSLVFAEDRSRLTEDRCESLLVPSNRRHGSDDNRTLSAAPYPFWLSFLTDW